MIKIKRITGIFSLLIIILTLSYYKGVWGFIGQTHTDPAISNDKLHYTLEINKTYGGINSETASSLLATTDGGFILAGSTNSYGAGLRDMWLVKTNNHGFIDWSKTYGGFAPDGASSIIAIKDGGYVIAGYTRSYGRGGNEMWLVKIDSTGSIEWDQTYGGISSEMAHSVLATNDGGYVLAGNRMIYSGRSMWIVKTNSIGEVE